MSLLQLAGLITTCSYNVSAIQNSALISKYLPARTQAEQFRGWAGFVSNRYRTTRNRTGYFTDHKYTQFSPWLAWKTPSRLKASISRLRGSGQKENEGRILPHSLFDHYPLVRSRLKFSISLSNVIILSSRPTTTSSNFSRSRIFSCNSALDSCRSRTTFS